MISRNHRNWEGYSLDYPELTRAAGNFLLHLQVGRREPSTREAYESQIAKFTEYAVEHSFPDLRRLTINEMREYLVHLQTRPYRFGKYKGPPKTISRTFYATVFRRINRFFNFCVKEGIIRSNPMADIPRVMETANLVPLVRDKNFVMLLERVDPRLLETPVKKALAIRDTAALWLLRDTPGRLEELASVTLDNINLPEKSIYVTGKSLKSRRMFLGETSFTALCEYLEVRQRLAPKTDRLWVKANGQSMGRTWIYLMLKWKGEAVGIERIHTHMFRHTFVVDMIKAGIGERVIEVMGGWENIPPTYKRMIDEQEAGKFQGYFSPADRLVRRTGARGRQVTWPDTWGMEWPQDPMSNRNFPRQLLGAFGMPLLGGFASGPQHPLDLARLAAPAPSYGQSPTQPGDLVSEIANAVAAILEERIPARGAYPSDPPTAIPVPLAEPVQGFLCDQQPPDHYGAGRGRRRRS